MTMVVVYYNVAIKNLIINVQEVKNHLLLLMMTGNNEVSNDDFKIMMDKKYNESNSNPL